MNRKEKEILQEAIEQAVAAKKCVILPDNSVGYLIRAYRNQFKIDDVYWIGKDEKIYRVFMEIREIGMHGIPGLFVVGTQSLDNFSSGNVSMIRPENRYFHEGHDKDKVKLKSNEKTMTPISDSLVGVLSRTYIVEKDGTECLWNINEDGTANCPYCNTYTIEDEYTGKPILFKYCPECGEFLNGPGRQPQTVPKGEKHE